MKYGSCKIMRNIKNVVLIIMALTLVSVFPGCTPVGVKETDNFNGSVLENITEPETYPAVPAVAIVNDTDSAPEADEPPVPSERDTEPERDTEREITPEPALAPVRTSAEAASPPTQQMTGADALARPPRNPDEKLIALTFDDGPSRHTERILEILAEHGGEATFFVVGSRVWNHRETVRNIIAQGSEVAGHSWHHYNLTRLDAQDIKDQIIYTNNAIINVTGIQTPPFFRPPYGAHNELVREASREAGAAIINWSIDTHDWRTRNADATYEHIMQNARDGAIVLMHDIHEPTAAAMERAIPSLIREGFRLVTVSELLSEIVPGRVYYSETNSRY